MASLINDQRDIEEGAELQKLNKVIAELNDDQKKFLADCDLEFSNRYTDDDVDYVNNKTKRDSCKKEPPIIENWWSRQSKRRDNDSGRHKRGHNDEEHRNQKHRRHRYLRFN
ncbi:uncharacterized protein [Chelonus insularis]|uniref:uncharacterized protein n=1 Tax=Chelonus insularis TaxID=460826 RepID=UPI00158E2525|nr:uncharacterized protein LOC118074052 [Chelonus insularis]